MEPKVIIPWRESESRRRVFDWVYRYYTHRFSRVIVSEHDDGGPFNKSKAINDGIRSSSPSHDDIYIVGDADCFLVDWALRGGVAAARNTSRIVRPHKRFLRTNKEQMEHIIKQDPTAEICFHWFHKCFAKKSAPGGVWVFRFDAFDRAGWMDEGYVGWGAEDNDMIRRMRSVCLKGAMYHLWHEPASDKNLQSPACRRYRRKWRRR